MQYQSEAGRLTGLSNEVIFSWRIIEDAQDIRYRGVRNEVERKVREERGVDTEEIIARHSDRLMHLAMNG